MITDDGSLCLKGKLPMSLSLEALVNDFAIRSFRDQADQDYIAARMANRAGLVTPYLWSSQQAIEKYMKCILLLNRIPATKVGHDLDQALRKILASGRVALNLTPPSRKFIEYLDCIGRFRYFEVSYYASSRHILTLDQAVWELRRYCSHSNLHKGVTLKGGMPAPRVRLIGGYLENILDHLEDPARGPLLWQNAYFGKRTRKSVKFRPWLKLSNSPLDLHPEMLDEVLKYIKLPQDVIEAYRRHKAP